MNTPIPLHASAGALGSFGQYLSRGLGALLVVLGATGWAHATSLEVTVRDDAGRPLKDAVVMLESPAASRAVRPLDSAAISQRGKAFVPTVLVVPRGTPVSFPNEDTVRHHVYSFSEPKRFELKLYIGTPPTPVVFDRAGVVVLGCNIHDDMLAWVVVTDTPHYGRTDAEGKVTMSQLPAGDFQLRVWHQRVKEGQPVHAQAQKVGNEPGRAAVTLQGLEAP